MRDKDRIPQVLGTIKTIWEKNPDLRLSQLILNATETGSISPLYYLEDDDLVDLLLQFYSNVQ